MLSSSSGSVRARQSGARAMESLETVETIEKIETILKDSLSRCSFASPFTGIVERLLALFQPIIGGVH